MIYLIKFIFFLLISFNAISKENEINEILFKINNKVFTNIDLEKRKEYVALINKITISEISVSENNQIQDDYISSLIFYEFYIQNKLVYENLNDEINLIYNENFKTYEKLNKIEVENFKMNISIDLIRNKIIESRLNYNKESLLLEVNTLDLLYNYNLEYIIIKEDLIDNKLIKNIDDKIKFNDLKNFLKKNEIKFFYKEKDINDNTITSNRIKKIINQGISIYKNNENGYINLISVNKSLESYEGVFVKLINFVTDKPLEKHKLQCSKLNKSIDISKTVFREYEYTKLNDKIKKNLKSINDYILITDNGGYNYIILCDLTFDKKLLENINFNKNINTLANKIQKNFLKKYKNEYRFIKIK